MDKKFSEQDICNELIGYVKSNIAHSSILIKKETPFNQIGLDSSSIIELVLFIERKFNVSIPEGDLVPDNLKSVEALARCTYKYI
jgi:acyl carrier protein